MTTRFHFAPPGEIDFSLIPLWYEPDWEPLEDSAGKDGLPARRGG